MPPIHRALKMFPGLKIAELRNHGESPRLAMAVKSAWCLGTGRALLPWLIFVCLYSGTQQWSQDRGGKGGRRCRGKAAQAHCLDRPFLLAPLPPPATALWWTHRCPSEGPLLLPERLKLDS